MASHQCNIRLPSEAWEKLKTLAEREGVPPATVARSLVLQGLKEHPRSIPILRQAYLVLASQIARLGNNLNQAVHLAHVMRLRGKLSRSEYEELVAAVEEIYSFLSELLRRPRKC